MKANYDREEDELTIKCTYEEGEHIANALGIARECNCSAFYRALDYPERDEYHELY